MTYEPLKEKFRKVITAWADYEKANNEAEGNEESTSEQIAGGKFENYMAELKIAVALQFGFSFIEINGQPELVIDSENWDGWDDFSDNFLIEKSEDSINQAISKLIDFAVER